MSHILWSKELSVGIDVIDKQHTRIVDYVNELHDVINQPPDAITRARIIAVVSDAIDYTESHFGFEEAMMEDAGYPFLKAHKKVHELFVRKVLEYKRRLDAGEDIAVELRETLKRWLINHIKNEDNDYSKWVIRSGAAAVADTGEVSPTVREAGGLKAWIKRLFD